MFRKLASTFFLLLFILTVSAYGQIKVGHLNSQEVLSNMSGRSEVEQELNNFVQEKRQELQQQTMAFQDSLTAYQENKASMSEAQIQQEEQQLSQLQNSIRQLQQNLQQQIQQRRATLLQPLYEKMNQAIADVAESQDLDFVLNKATSAGENVIYYSASENLDITKEVLQRINGTSAKN